VVSDSGVRQYYPSGHHQSRRILSVTDPSAVTSLPTGSLFESYSDSWLKSCEARGLKHTTSRTYKVILETHLKPASGKQYKGIKPRGS